MPRINPKTGQPVKPTNKQLIEERDQITTRMNQISSRSFGATCEWHALDERLDEINAELDRRRRRGATVPQPADWNTIPF